MKYKYRKMMIALQWSSVFVYAGFLLYLFFLMGKDVEWIQKNSIIAIVFLLLYILNLKLNIPYIILRFSIVLRITNIKPITTNGKMTYFFIFFYKFLH